jgi:hypothetical protein
MAAEPTRQLWRSTLQNGTHPPGHFSQSISDTVDVRKASSPFDHISDRTGVRQRFPESCWHRRFFNQGSQGPYVAAFLNCGDCVRCPLQIGETFVQPVGELSNERFGGV